MVYLFLAEGHEEIEALTPLDILRRAGVPVKTVGVGGKTVKGAHGIPVVADITDESADFSDIDAIILPGGMPGTLNLQKSEQVNAAIQKATERKSLIAAICAAPMILGELGLLSGREAICFPGFEDKLNGATISNNPVCRSGNIITACGAGVAAEFGFAVLTYLKSESEAAELRKAMKYI